MYAIVEIKNSQFKVSEGDTIIVDKTNVESGKSIEFDKVLLFKTEKDVLIGKPYVANAKVKGKVIGEEKGKKVVVKEDIIMIKQKGIDKNTIKF